VCSPLAVRAARLPNGAARHRVTELIEACHEAVTVVGTWIAADAHERAERVADPDRRRLAMRETELSAGPSAPTLTENALHDATWPAALAELARPYSAGLSALLGAALPPGHNDLRGQPSRSEKLEKLLRETIDPAARELDRYLTHRETHKPLVAPSERVYTQTEQRGRRRARQRVTYTETFSLTDEIAGICEPLATRLARLRAHRTTALVPPQVTELGSATHALVCAVVGLLGEESSAAQVRHLRPADQQRARRLLSELTARPPEPVIECGEVDVGSWGSVLADMARPYSGPLAELLGRSLPPEHDELYGAAAVSDRLVEVLRDTIDPAALRFERWIHSREIRQPRKTPDPAAAARAALHELGVNI